MHAALGTLLDILDIEAIELNLFRGQHPPGTRGRLYGGQIMAQALMSAGRTVSDAVYVHSLHGYFLRPGDPSLPVVFNVDRIRDGTSFVTRRVVAVQKGHAIFELSASFQVEETGLEHAFEAPASQPPEPKKIPDGIQHEAFISWTEDFRSVYRDQPHAPNKNVWFRSNGDIPADDALLHACLLTYQSDDALLSTARLPHRGTFDRAHMQVASLDHAMWFHHRARADQWLLYVLDSPSASEARGYNRGSIFTESGKLVASTMQEGLMRRW